MAKLNPNPWSDEYEFIDYINSQTKCKIRHKVCGFVMEMIPNNFNKRHTTCQKCFGSRIEKTKHRILSLYGTTNVYKINPNIINTTRIKNQSLFEQKLDGFTLVSKYTQIKSNITVKCNTCNNLFTFDGGSLAYDHPKCPNCNNIDSSPEELELMRLVRIKYPSAYKYHHVLYDLDIFIPELKIGFEYNSSYWHSNQKVRNKYMNHYNKKKYFIQLGIQVFYLWDFMGMEFIKKFIIDVLNNKEPSIKPYDDSIDLMRVSIEDYDNIVPSDEEPIYINDRLFTISKAGKFKEV